MPYRVIPIVGTGSAVVVAIVVVVVSTVVVGCSEVVGATEVTGIVGGAVSYTHLTLPTIYSV